jgi:hypothetical protein
MFHLFRFVAGVLTGMAAMSLIKSQKAKAGLEKAEDTMRGAAVTTLEAVESASAKARTHLEGEADAADAGQSGEAAADSAPRKKPRAKAD